MDEVRFLPGGGERGRDRFGGHAALHGHDPARHAERGDAGRGEPIATDGRSLDEVAATIFGRL